jgi:mycothiol synthase
MMDPELSVVEDPDAAVVEEINALIDRVALATNHAAISEAKRLALLHAGPEGPESAPQPSPTTASGEPRLLAAVVANDRVSGQLVGYAPVVGDVVSGQYAMEVALDPVASDPATLFDRLVDGACTLVADSGGRALRLWISKASDADDERARAHGFQAERHLIQMRCALPLTDPGRKAGPAPAIRTRAFRPGHDEGAWLATNNRAFASHPEQGHWDLATLLEREEEAWFDPDGLLLLEEDGRLAGSCWTKVHADTQPPMGEIYVIGVDPDFHGRGWGRALTQAGLDWLAEQGLTVGMLYVDADNTAAVSMYRSMGFTDDHVDRSYLRTFS